MFRLLEKLENPDRPLLGPNIKILQFWGLLLPKNKLSKIVYLCIHLFIALFIGATYLDIWFIKDDLSLLFLNLKITMLGTISLCKVFTFLIWQKDWWSIVNYVTRADIACRASDVDPKKQEIINSYTRYSRRITFSYTLLLFITTVMVILQPFFKYISSSTYRFNIKNGTDVYMHVVSSWMPFDKNIMPGYFFASLIEIFGTIYGAAWITSYDCNVFVIMTFLKAELEILRIDSAKIFGTEELPVPDNVAAERLKNCHKRHIELIKYIRILDSCLSPNMQLYMIVCTVMLCVTAYQMTNEASIMQQIMAAEYLVFGIAQLFIYCWHSTGMEDASRRLSLGPYESVWWNRNVSQRKMLIILTAQFRQSMVFSAGPFTKLTMTTYINILKGAYSYYTILNNFSSQSH